MDSKETTITDLEYLMREGLEDSRILTKKGIKTAKKILHKALSLIQYLEKFEKILDEVQEIEYPSDIDFSRIKEKYFPEGE